MALNGARATNDPLDFIIERFHQGCLRASVEGSLDRDWREQLLNGIRVKPEGTAVSVITVTYGEEEGWFSLLREDNTYKADFWAPELRRANNKARPTIDIIAKELGAALAPEHIRIRGIRPREWLERKGLSLRGAKRAPVRR